MDHESFLQCFRLIKKRLVIILTFIQEYFVISFKTKSIFIHSFIRPTFFFYSFTRKYFSFLLMFIFIYVSKSFVLNFHVIQKTKQDIKTKRRISLHQFYIYFSFFKKRIVIECLFKVYYFKNKSLFVFLNLAF